MKKLATVFVVMIMAIGLVSCSDDSTPETPVSETAPVAEETPAEEPVVEEPEEETPPEPTVPTYNGGQHKIGTDMPAGEYVIIGNGYLEVASDSTGAFESIITNDNYENRTIITVNDGEYLQFSGTAYAIDDAPPVDLSSGILPEGKYLVGKDLPAGEYKIAPTGSLGGYSEVSSTSRGDLYDIIANDVFDAEKYLTVSDGQYLKFSMAELYL